LTVREAEWAESWGIVMGERIRKQNINIPKDNNLRTHQCENRIISLVCNVIRSEFQTNEITPGPPQ
jgi:hypothetical protein